MPRTVSITVPADKTEPLLAQLRLLPLVSLQVQRGISISPPGDVIAVVCTSRVLHELLHLLDAHQLGRGPHSSIVTSDVASAIASPAAPLVTDTSEGIWEELESDIARESNMTPNGLLLMAGSGALASLGIAMDAVNVVIGGMVIAPGFEPLVRISLGVVGRSRAWKRGLVDVGKGYLALALAAGATALLLRALGYPPLGGQASYLDPGKLASFWTTLSGTSVLATAVAALAGAVLIVSRRTVLTAGVLIALSLIPGAALVPMCLIAGQPAMAGRAAALWAMNAVLVIAFMALVAGWKRRWVYRRDSLL